MGAMTSSQTPARLLDVTRLIRRAGRVLTGVDRVELAYAQRLTAEATPCYGLVRSPLGYLLLNASAMTGVIERAHGAGKPPAPDFLSRLAKGHSKEQRAAFSDARACANARCLPQNLRRMLVKHLPKGTSYLNVGHSNLTVRVLEATKNVGPISVLVHDIIPLERPADQSAESVVPFREKMHRVSRYADLVICNTADTKTRFTQYLAQKDWRQPKMIVSHLGTKLTEADPAALPEGLPPIGKYFITVGTIEPRKNHAFLLDLWDEMGDEAPTLVVVGKRGWKNEFVFKRLDAMKNSGKLIEAGALSDPALTALVQGASGMLFPSLAEGFGWPPIEAAALGVPVLANDLDVYQEVLGNIPIYASVSDRYLWINKIKELAAAGARQQDQPRFVPPTWDAHFKIVLTLT